MVLVFGSGKNEGAAKAAKKFFGASDKPGKAGFCYAIPVREGGRLASLESIEAHVRTFIEFAKSTPGIHYYLTKVACEEGEYRNDQIAPMFADAPENVTIPGLWVNIINAINRKPFVSRVVVTGPRNFRDYDFLSEKMGFYLSRLSMESVEIVSGGEAGTDEMGARYASEHGLRIAKPHTEIERFGRSAGYPFCNFLWSLYATHMLVFHDDASVVVQNLVETAVKEGLRVAVVNVLKRKEEACALS